MNQGLHGLTTPKALELWAQKYKCLEHPIVKKTSLTQMTDSDDSLLYHAEPQLLPKTDEAQAEADFNDEDDDLLFHAQSQLLPEKEEDPVSSSARNDDDMLFHAETQMLAAEDPASKQDQGTPGESQDILLFAQTSQTEMSDSQLQKLIFGQSRAKCNQGPISELADQLLAEKGVDRVQQDAATNLDISRSAAVAAGISSQVSPDPFNTSLDAAELGLYMGSHSSSSFDSNKFNLNSSP
ncbi:MAG: hypothetical protein AB2570_19555 [Candidatus Thiodiazotropha endolucinida]